MEYIFINLFFNGVYLFLVEVNDLKLHAFTLFIIGKLTQCVFGHWDVVTCLAYSDDMVTGSNAIIVSGSADATVLVWIWDHKGYRIIGPNDATSKKTLSMHNFLITVLETSLIM